MNKPGFAYLDSYGNLHVVEDIETAVKYSSTGKIEKVNIPHATGWPQVLLRDGYESIIVKTQGRGDEIWEKEGLAIPKHLAELAKRLK